MRKPPTEDLVTLIIRGVPAPLRQMLKVKAAAEGKSMQALIIEQITEYLGKKEAKGRISA